MIDGEPFAGASPAGHDFVGNHQHAVAIADLAQPREILRRRDENAVGADDRLDDDRRDIALVLDHVLDIVDARHIAAGVGVLDRALVAVRLGRENDVVAFAGRLHGPAPRIAGGRDRPRGRAVIGPVARDDLVLSRHHASDLERGFIGLGAAGGEEEFLETRRQNLKKLGAEPGAGLGSVDRADKGEIARLLRDGLDDRADSCGRG